MGRAANQAPAPPPTDDAEDDARGDDDDSGRTSRSYSTPSFAHHSWKR